MKAEKCMVWHSLAGPTGSTFVVQRIHTDIVVMVLESVRTSIDGLQFVRVGQVRPTPQTAIANDARALARFTVRGIERSTTETMIEVLGQEIFELTVIREYTAWLHRCVKSPFRARRWNRFVLISLTL